MEETKRMGHFRRSWELTKSAWQVLKLDKELVSFPLMSTVASLFVLIPFAILAIVNASLTRDVYGNIDGVAVDFGNWGILIGFSILFLLTLVSNVFGAAIIHGALQRYRGGDPTIGSSLQAAKRRFGSIAAFSLLATTVGFVLRMIEERVPFAGKIAVWLVDAAWNIATLFAIPVIISSEEPVGPIDASKKSVAIIKKVWGESFVISFGIGVVAALGILGWISLSVATIAILSVAGLTTVTVSIIGGSIFVIGIVTLAMIFSALSAIAKAAVYYYATTNESPELFNKDLLRQAMTPKKARKIFG